MKLIYIFVILILASSIVTAAEVKGTIYDFSLNKIKNAVIEVNTQPAQKTVSIDGTYSFNIPKGSYEITAKTTKNTIIAKEYIEIKDEGSFNIDLFVFPELEEDLLEEELDLEPIDLEEANYTPLIVVIIIILVLSAYYIYKKQITKNKEHKDQSKKEDSKEEAKTEEDLLVKVLEIIRKEERINQKDLRKQFPLSEAKISLVISELESKGKIEKIKKGRGNILIIKKDQ